MRKRADSQLRKCSGGFTLVELLLAIALTAVVAALAYAGLANGIGAAAALGTEVQELADLQRTLAIVEDDLAQVRLRDATARVGMREAAFVTAPEPGVLLAFTRAGAFVPPGQLRSGLLRIRYVLRANALWRQQWTAVDRADNLQPPVEVLLLGQVQSAGFELLAPAAGPIGSDALALQSSGGNWLREWDSSAVHTALQAPLPLAVRLTLSTDHYAQVQRVVELP